MAERQVREKSEARRYLENIGWMRTEIEKLTQLNREYNERKVSVRGQDYSKERVQTSPDGDVMKMVDWYNDEIRKNNLTIFEYDKECKKAKEYIDSLDKGLYSDVLYYNYIRNFHLDKVADLIARSYSRTRMIKSEALIAFQAEVVDKLKANGKTLQIYKPHTIE